MPNTLFAVLLIDIFKPVCISYNASGEAFEMCLSHKTIHTRVSSITGFVATAR
jgi:hypothetical protein